MVERENAEPVLIVQLSPEFIPDIDPEPDSQMHCHYEHDPHPTVRKRINYSINFQHVNYVFTGVWVNKCEKCGEVYFSPVLGNSVYEEMCERIQWLQLLELNSHEPNFLLESGSETK